MTDRLERLAERLEEPLLVTDLVNVRYLCGFDSSNAALLVERDRVRLFTDFRYIDEARAVAGVEAVQTRRDSIGELSETLTGRVGFETTLPFGQYERLRQAGLDLVPRSGTVERSPSFLAASRLGVDTASSTPHASVNSQPLRGSLTRATTRGTPNS